MYYIKFHTFYTNFLLNIKINFDEFNNKLNDLKCYVYAECFGIKGMCEAYYISNNTDNNGIVETLNVGGAELGRVLTYNVLWAIMTKKS